MLQLHKILTTLMILAFSTSALAENKNNKYDDSNDYDYNSSFYQQEGRILFKVRAQAIMTNAKQKNLPTPTSSDGKASPAANGHFLANGYGAEAATTLFFSDYVAAELGLGVSNFKVSQTAVNNVGYNYKDLPTQGKRHSIIALQAGLIPQVHLAPFGAIRPYVGFGYSGAYFRSKAKEYKIKNTAGPVAQVGVDFVLNDDTMICFDVKKYWMNPRLNYSKSYANDVKAKLPMNPVVVSLGFGYKF